MIQDTFLQFCMEQGLFDSHQKVLLALSGGLDSMTLVDLLYTYRDQLDINLVLVHINHHQRLESDQEEAGIRALATEKKIPLRVAHFSGPFSESRARKFRYDFFKKVMEEENCSALVTAHHADDQAETVLMRLIRGARPRHLRGIPLVQPFGPGSLIRPLLPFQKKDFPDTFHYEDESNHSLSYFRNRVRHRYLPLLEEENPQVSTALIRLGKDLDHWHQALKELTKDLDPQNVIQYQEQTNSVQFYLLEEYLTSFPDLQLNRAQFEQLHAILTKKANTQQALKNGYEVYKDYEFFEIRKISRKADDQAFEDLLQFGTMKIVGSYCFSFGIEPKEPYIESVNLPTTNPVCLRSPKTGDRILVNGHHRKISRLFINQKIPLKRRKSAILIEQDQEILAIPEIAISDLSKDLKNDIMKGKLYIQKKDR